MKILLGFHGGGRGGDATVCLDLYEAYIRLGCEVDFYARVYEKRVFVERLESRNIPCTILGSWKELKAAVGKQAASYDAVHFNTPNEWPLVNSEALQLRKIFPRHKLFCTLHGSRSLIDLCQETKNRWSAKVGILCFNKVIVPSQHKLRDWRKLLKRNANIVRIPNPIPPLREIAQSEAKQTLDVDPSQTVVSFVGILRPEKGITEFLNVAARPEFRDLQFLVAGRGELEKECHQSVEESNAPVRFLGYQIDPTPTYRAANVYVFPSILENYPIALFQAAGAGIPMVASDIPVVLDELNYPGAVFTFKAGDEEDMARALSEALSGTSCDSCQNMGKIVTETHLCDSIARTYLELFSGVADQR